MFASGNEYETQSLTLIDYILCAFVYVCCH